MREATDQSQLNGNDGVGKIILSHRNHDSRESRAGGPASAEREYALPPDPACPVGGDVQDLDARPRNRRRGYAAPSSDSPFHQALCFAFQFSNQSSPLNAANELEAELRWLRLIRVLHCLCHRYFTASFALCVTSAQLAMHPDHRYILLEEIRRSP